MVKMKLILLTLLLMVSLGSLVLAGEDPQLPNWVVLYEVGGCSVGISELIQPDGKILVSATSFINNYHQAILLRRNQDGSDDKTFGKCGLVTTEIIMAGLPGFSVYTKGLALQEDGKVVIAAVAQPPEHHPRSGRYNDDVLVIRYNPDGQLDKSFNGSGWIKTDVSGTIDKVSGVGLQHDGKIIIFGYSLNPNILIDTYDFMVLRYGIDGTLDKRFGDQGKVLTRVRGIMWDAIGMTGAIQQDDKILVGGRVIEGHASTDMAVVRYMPNGELDETFASRGKEIRRFSDGGKYKRSEVETIVLQPDGKIIIGVNSKLMRYNNNGRIDETFGNDGVINLKSRVIQLLVQKDGKILFLGRYVHDSKNYGLAIGRINVEGTPDTSFGRNGITQLLLPGGQIAIQPDGGIIVASASGKKGTSATDCREFRRDLVLLRLKSDGQIDGDFGSIR